MEYTYELTCFDLKQIADSGQCFRMKPLSEDNAADAACCPKSPAAYRLVSRDKVMHIEQAGSLVTFDCEERDLPYWLHYFDCERDYQALIDSIDRNDAYLTAAARAGRGIRILCQDPWEMIITFVISQQKTIPKIRELVERLCRHYGTPLADGLYAFPTPKQLSRATLPELLDMKLGYRAKYIHRLCQDAVYGRLDLEALSSMDYEAAMEYLSGFYGIGKKVANCICLFGLHHIDAFPVDTWIQKILLAHYFDEKKYRDTPKSSLYEQIIKDSFGRYSGYAGVMQQYIFYYERLESGKLR